MITNLDKMDTIAVTADKVSLQYHSPVLRQWNYWFNQHASSFPNANTTLQCGALGNISVEEWTWSPLVVMSNGDTIQQQHHMKWISGKDVAAVQYFRDTGPQEGNLYLGEEDADKVQ